MAKNWIVYVCDKKGTLYTGITTDLTNRIRQHRARLIYQESCVNRETAVRRERQLKGWSRKKKLALADSGL